MITLDKEERQQKEKEKEIKEACCYGLVGFRFFLSRAFSCFVGFFFFTFLFASSVNEFVVGL